MSKIGIVNVAGLQKPISIVGMNVVQFNSNSIGISYGVDLTSFQWGNQYVFIQFSNPSNEVSPAFIKKQFYRWVTEGLTASSPAVLNEYLPQLIITDTGVRGSISTGVVASAGDLTTACNATPNILVALDYAGGGTPPVGTYIYDPNANGNGLPGPIAAGTYSFGFLNRQYFISVNSSSLISSIEICPFLLDFVYNLKNLGAGPVTSTNTDAISFTVEPTLTALMLQTYLGYYYYNTSLDSNPNPFTSCDISSVDQVFGPNNAMWPVGILNNATTNKPDFSNLDVAIGLVLNDSSVASFNGAQLYISFDYNTVGAANASFQPFVFPSGQNPLFPSSPDGGIPGFGNGTSIFTQFGSLPVLSELFSTANSQTGTIYLPPGQSLIGSATFTSGAFGYWSTTNGTISFTLITDCPA